MQGAHWLFYGNMYCSILFMTWPHAEILGHREPHGAPQEAGKHCHRRLPGNMAAHSAAYHPLVRRSARPPTSRLPTSRPVTTFCRRRCWWETCSTTSLSLAIGVFLFPAFLTASAYVLMIRTLQSSAMDELRKEEAEGHQASLSPGPGHVPDLLHAQ